MPTKRSENDVGVGVHHGDRADVDPAAVRVGKVKSDRAVPTQAGAMMRRGGRARGGGGRAGGVGDRTRILRTYG